MIVMNRRYSDGKIWHLRFSEFSDSMFVFQLLQRAVHYFWSCIPRVENLSDIIDFGIQTSQILNHSYESVSIDWRISDGIHA